MAAKPPDPHYEDAVLASLYDLDSGWSEDRDFYLALAGRTRKRILDLGCSTGLLSDACAAIGHEVTGVDPAKAMLDVARRKPHGPLINWVRSTAQAFRSAQRFDLVIMTGHAFQVLLDDDDILATFATMRAHLAAGGMVAFESRNPAVDWPAIWDYDIDLDLGGSTVREQRRFLKLENKRMSFELRYAFPDKALVSASELLFLSRREIEERLVASGMKLESVFGNWDSGPFEEGSSREMIFIARRA